MPILILYPTAWYRLPLSNTINVTAGPAGKKKRWNKDLIKEPVVRIIRSFPSLGHYFSLSRDDDPQILPWRSWAFPSTPRGNFLRYGALPGRGWSGENRRERKKRERERNLLPPYPAQKGGGPCQQLACQIKAKEGSSLRFHLPKCDVQSLIKQVLNSEIAARE